MPYIEYEYREQMRPTTRQKAMTPGDLNFQITCLLNDYVGYHGKRYMSINDALGALEGAKLEFYRRVAVPYENDKHHLNGDVYTCV